MPPYHKHRRQNGAKSHVKSSAKNRPTKPAGRSSFVESRTQDVEDDDQQQSDPDLSVSEEEELQEDSEQFATSDEEDIKQVQPKANYANLLQALQPASRQQERPSKRRKLNGENAGSEARKAANAESVTRAQEEELADAGLTVELEEDDAHDGEADSEDEGAIAQDLFEQHYAKLYGKPIVELIKTRDGKGNVSRTTLPENMHKAVTTYDGTGAALSRSAEISQQLKQRLKAMGKTTLNAFTPTESDLVLNMFSYKDIIAAFRSVENASRIRNMTCLHTLNHIFKTRDRVLKNNSKLAQENTTDLELRDQGFTRPKVLILLPTKQSCISYINTLVHISRPDQQESRSRLLETFSQPIDDNTFTNKPPDFQELFGGNHEEDFRIGLKFTRKTIKYFSGFYNSDIILASPLGLMRTITHGGGDKETSKADSDFLSSIELLIMDQTNALEFQNWSHVDFVLSHLNAIPRDSHGCDFGRVREWYLEGHAKYLRQTIIISEYLTPSILNLINTHCHNIAGTVRYTPTYPGTMTQLPVLPFQLTQTFLRFPSTSPQIDADMRFQFFTNSILPPILRHKSRSSRQGTLVFVPAYSDFTRLRNHFSTSPECTSLTFGTISEYTSKSDVARARSHFLSGRQSVLLYTERAHHYFRYRLRGVKKIVSYGLPENAQFYSEIVEMLGETVRADEEFREALRGTSGNGTSGKGLLRALFSKWDVLKLERIVGSERVGKLVAHAGGDVFDFV